MLLFWSSSFTVGSRSVTLHLCGKLLLFVQCITEKLVLLNDWRFGVAEGSKASEGALWLAASPSSGSGLWKLLK